MDVAAVVAQGSVKGPNRAEESREGEHDHGVGSGEADLKGAAMVSVHDPTLAEPRGMLEC